MLPHTIMPRRRAGGDSQPGQNRQYSYAVLKDVDMSEPRLSEERLRGVLAWVERVYRGAEHVDVERTRLPPPALADDGMATAPASAWGW